MGPKKAEKKAGGGDGEKDFDAENKMLQKRLEVLQYRLMVKDDAIAQCMRDEETHKKTIDELDSGFNQESDRALENTAEMQRQYREMQNSFNERIEDLQLQVAQSKADIEAVRDEIEKTAVEKDDVISAKDDEIRSLTLKMETMAFEFADMLKETLDKMSQRIEISHSSWDRDPSRPPLMNRLKEFSLTDS
mmetsp:Transcript_6087/g.15045  ORF Transcript_6087/g.15045 Transcript_6087/m.15045 type:complete len:191 (-) Transcript_6087:184-756(-)|eukprot:CAMPEP_0179005686 /NCGR_PEP_ID=MMETSP0795-20121207/14094_1 /TAXON_ID=88552 /ORGANISM="Amoebophrya sp., Strain Ameob2" /LENGTH=190 /DNA_ID=CAMNT_0020700279 /DNA_START=473 /DNA_END=1045 /DNA_ORIENTATION=-